MLIYTEVKVNTIEDLKYLIEYNKEFQLQKFKNGISTKNWNNREIIICEDFFVDENDLNNFIKDQYIGKNIFCVKLYKFQPLELSLQTTKDIYDSIIELEYDVNNIFYQNLIDRTKKQTSLTKSCNSCKSIIKIEHIHYHKCPVCFDEKFLFTDTDKQSFENKLNRLNKHKENFLDKSNKYKEKNIKKINKFLKNELNEDEIKDFEIVWVVVSEEDAILDEMDLSLIPLRQKAYEECQLKKHLLEDICDKEEESY